jgi:iron-sulfur cluster repair protein YtfE (RIC family)
MVPFSHTLRDEHRRQVARIEHIRTVADSIGVTPVASLREALGHLYLFLLHQVLPRAQAEEQVLYPAIGRLLGALEATGTMSRDHLEVLHLTQEVEAQWLRLFYAPMTVPDEQALRRALYGLYEVVKLHLAKEEEMYLPLLEERLSAEEGGHLVEAMERVVAEARCRLRKGELREAPENVPLAHANICTDLGGKAPYTVPQPSPVL